MKELYIGYITCIIILVLFLLYYINKNTTNIYHIHRYKDNENNDNYTGPKVVNRTYNIKSYISSNLDKYTQKIPFKIHQTYKSFNMDVQYYQSCMANRYMNLEYEYFFYDDKMVYDYIAKNYPEYLYLYNTIIPGAYKADLFRYLVLYKEGGVYLDCKSSTIIPLRMFIPRDVGFISFLDRTPGTIQISFIASVAGHPLLKKCIDNAFYNIENKLYGESSLDITGPRLCGRSLNQLLNKTQKKIDVGYYKDIDVLIIGTMKIDENGYDVMVDEVYEKDRLLVSKACCSYYSNRLKQTNYYSTVWDSRKVYKNSEIKNDFL